MRRRTEIGLLLLIVTAGATLRLWHLGTAPPGLNQDEACNAWNALCILQTGRDADGDAWPIRYFRGTGQNVSTLFLYVLLPFQWCLGLGAQSLRLPPALLGIATIVLLYRVGKRLFGPATGLVAAAVLAISPWHIQQSRWGHEAAIAPFLIVLPIALALAASLPLDGVMRKPRTPAALLAGLVGGICCYGYFPVRLFLPLLLIGAVIVNRKAWLELIRGTDGTRAAPGRRALMAAAIGFAATFGPLAWAHAFDSEIGRRGALSRVWEPSDGWSTRALKMAARYPGHFGMDFLFINGDHYPVQSTGTGNFPLYAAPLMLAGAIACVRGWRASGALRFLVVWIVLYPIPDCISRHQSMHALRSLAGLPGLALLAGVGAVAIFDACRSVGRALAVGVALLGLLAAVASLALFARSFYRDYDRRPDIYYIYHTDFLAALDWLKPRFDDYDAIVCTTRAINMGHLLSLVRLGYEPARWFSEPREFRDRAGWQVCTRFGKMYFDYDDSVRPVVAGMRSDEPRQRVLFIVRPYEYAPGREVMRIVDPDGKPALVLQEEWL